MPLAHDTGSVPVFLRSCLRSSSNFLKRDLVPANFIYAELYAATSSIGKAAAKTVYDGIMSETFEDEDLTSL